MKFDLDIDKIKYLKILYADTNGSPVTIKAGLKKITEHEITACIKFEDYFNIKTPQDITLSVVGTNGLYRTKTVLKSYSSDPPYIFLYLEKPENMDFMQNREYFRVPVSYKCKYMVNNNGIPALFDAEISDISASGVSIILPVHVFSEKDSKIEIITDKRIIIAGIKYIRSERINDGYKLSFAFTKISEKDRDCISQICILKQIETKRNNIV